jgi:hypothetical protein
MILTFLTRWGIKPEGKCTHIALWSTKYILLGFDIELSFFTLTNEKLPLPHEEKRVQWKEGMRMKYTKQRTREERS